MESQSQKFSWLVALRQLFNLKFGSIYDKIGEVFTRKPYNLTKLWTLCEMLLPEKTVNAETNKD